MRSEDTSVIQTEGKNWHRSWVVRLQVIKHKTFVIVIYGTESKESEQPICFIDFNIIEERTWLFSVLSLFFVAIIQMTNNKVVTIRFVYHFKRKKKMKNQEKNRTVYDRLLSWVLSIKLTFFYEGCCCGRQIFFCCLLLNSPDYFANMMYLWSPQFELAVFINVRKKETHKLNHRRKYVFIDGQPS